MRLYILRALVTKEVRRHLANRGGLALAGLLVVAALLLSLFNPAANGGQPAGGLVDGVHTCFVIFPEDTDLTRHLKESVPPGLRVVFSRRPPSSVRDTVEFAAGTAALILDPGTDATGKPTVCVRVWHPPGDPMALAVYEKWFWKAAREAYQKTATDRVRAGGGDPAALTAPDTSDDDLWAVRDSFRQLDEQVTRLAPTAAPLPKLELKRDGLSAKELDLRSAVATAMVVFALYFTCVYLLPTLNCEERERGVLLAQALSPASPLEILAAKFLFYPVAGMALAAVLAGIYKPAVVTTLFFWLALLAIGGGFLGIGMTVATLARTQRAAFMGSMCYLLSVSLILFICSTNSIPLIPYLAIEYHGPRVLHAAVTGDVKWYHWGHLCAAFGLAAVWLGAAGYLFRTRGWQ